MNITPKLYLLQFVDYELQKIQLPLQISFKTRKSKKDGGILGHVEAFYGGVENTEHGRLHAHFEIWMAGALNPTEIHQHLNTEEDFDKHLFEYLENIIKHDLPQTGVIVEDDYEP